MATIRNHISQQDEWKREQHANHMAASIMNGYPYGDCAPGQKEPGLRVIPCHVEKVTPLTTDYKGAV